MLSNFLNRFPRSDMIGSQFQLMTLMCEICKRANTILKFFWRCKSHVSPRWLSKQNWVENRMRLIFYSISKFIQFIRSSLYCARCLCCHDNALAAFVTRAKGEQNCCWCSLKSSKYANEINIPSEYELTDGKNLLVNNDDSSSKETKFNV